ncbi:MAG: U32 family peptidase [bacterium]|nr:U32 family peptidase [bacterium]
MDIIVKLEKDLEEYIKLGINTFLLPLEDFSVEYSKYYSLAEIKKVREKYPKIELFISINKNIMNEEIDPLKDILIQLDNLNIKGIFFYDSALIRLMKKLKLNVSLVWAQTHMVTNYNSCNYYYDNGVEYAMLSKELRLDEVKEIISKARTKSIIELITKPSIAFSKRHLVTNYYTNVNEEVKDEVVVNEKISDTDLIVKENEDGSTFIKNSILNGFVILDELMDTNLSYILIKEDYIDHDLFIKIITNLVYYLNNYKKMDTLEKEKFIKNQAELLGNDTGFFFRKMIYKVK